MVFRWSQIATLVGALSIACIGVTTPCGRCMRFWLHDHDHCHPLTHKVASTIIGSTWIHLLGVWSCSTGNKREKQFIWKNNYMAIRVTLSLVVLSLVWDSQVLPVFVCVYFLFIQGNILGIHKFNFNEVWLHVQVSASVLTTKQGNRWSLKPLFKIGFNVWY